MTSDTDTDTSDTWLTYTEAAKRLGVSANAIKQRVKRGKLLAARGNDGQPRVSIGCRSADTDTVKQNRTTPTPATPAAPMVSFDQALAMVAQERTETARQLSARDSLHREAMAMMVERVDAAECRAERVEQRLDQVLDALLQRRPWWRAW